MDYSTNIWGSGDLDKMFERIITEPAYQQYEPKVLSRPTLAPGDTWETAEYAVGGPWMVVFDKFVTEPEADRLVELGADIGYERSLDVQKLNDDGSVAGAESFARTSSNAWCTGECEDEPMVMAVTDRIAEVTSIPQNYAESLQLLRYTEGQFCKYPRHLMRQTCCLVISCPSMIVCYVRQTKFTMITLEGRCIARSGHAF